MKDIITIYDIINYLIENSSYDMPVKTEVIYDHFVRKAGLSETEVKTAFSDIISEYLNCPLVLGIAVREKVNGYYVDLPFSETDIAVLRSMLLSLPYCERWQTSELMKRLNGFLPHYMRDETDVIHTNSEKYNGTFYENMTEILKALYPVPDNKNEEYCIYKIDFEYCEYNDSLQLEARASHTDGSIIRTANPLKIICMNNFFYLVAFYYNGSEVKFINYRIDRMKNVKCTDIPAEKFEDYISEKRKYILDLKRNIDKGKKTAVEENRIYHEPNDDIAVLDEARRIDNNGFNIGEYLHRSKIMYTDKMIDRVSAKVDRKSLNGIIDIFGFDIDVYPYDEKYLTVYIHNVTETTVIKWALQFYESAQVTAPAELCTKIASVIASLAEKYEHGGSSNDV